MRIGRRRKRRTRDRLSPFKAGALGIIVIILAGYGAYTKFANPLASHFTVNAVFPNANGLRPESLVRIAGVNVGKVTGVTSSPGCARDTSSKCQASEVTMQIEDIGLPIHRDATFAIRPRIFLEGNFFVDIRPGSPTTPIAGNGHTFPIQQGTEPVQLDQVLTSLQAGTRKNLQVLLDQYGKAVDKSGASYNRSIQYWLPAYKYTAIVSHDALGIQPHDLSNWVAQMGTVAGAFDAHPPNLENLITDFNTTANSFARENNALASAVAELPRTLAAATPAFDALNAAFPPLRLLARTLEPGVVSTGPAIDVSLPFINQLRQLVQPAELRGLTADLAVTIPALARLTKATIPLMKTGVRPLASCVSNVIYPWSQLTLNDHTLSGTPGMPLRQVYVEAVDFLPGLAGESRVFDANGPYIRVLGNGGSLTYSLQPGLFGQSLAPITSVQPRLPPGGNRPPLHSGVPCETQAPITDLSAPAGPPLQQVATDLSAPGASLRWKSAAQSMLGMIRSAAKQQNVAVTLSSQVKQALK
jgi:ABC-type transporter Mla subunit MlaD